MNKQDVIVFFRKRHACDRAIIWLIDHPGTLEEIYADCNNADWLAWLYDELGLTDDYERVKHPAWDEYRLIKRAVLLGCNRAALGMETFERITMIAWNEYKRKVKLDWQVVIKALESKINQEKTT
jgi:hypothetical protein